MSVAYVLDACNRVCLSERPLNNTRRAAFTPGLVPGMDSTTGWWSLDPFHAPCGIQAFVWVYIPLCTNRSTLLLPCIVRNVGQRADEMFHSHFVTQLYNAFPRVFECLSHRIFLALRSPMITPGLWHTALILFKKILNFPGW